MHTSPLLSTAPEGRWFSERLGSAVFQCDKDFSIEGRLEHFAKYSLVIQFYNSHPPLLNSQRIPSVTVYLHGNRIYQGQGVITSMLETGSNTVCEVALDNASHSFHREQASHAPENLAGAFRSFLSDWRKIYKLLPEYKLVVSDMQVFFLELKHFLEEIELKNSPCSEERLRQLAEALRPDILPAIASFFEEFEHVSAKLDAPLLPVHRAYMKRQLHSLVLCCPFAYRTYVKPLGYPGDFEMVNMIHRKQPEGDSLFAKILNLWFVDQPPARAHRNRIEYLKSVLLQEALRAAGKKQPFRVLSLGCGPALEVQDFLRNWPLAARAEFTLVDFNSETLDHVKSVMSQIAEETGKESKFTYLKHSIVHFLKETKSSQFRQNFDLIYCAGVFDYLSDQVCRRLSAMMHDWLAPDGLLIMTNVHESNPLRHGMEHLLDWHLIYRDAAQCQALCPPGVSPHNFTVHSETTGINIFVELRKTAD
jgi:extracellular factor (EF) 3-hydroxypalmitic acid methyl ester biosynthesis protein